MATPASIDAAVRAAMTPEEFEAAFPYDLTPDQSTAVADIKRDMESRLLEKTIAGRVTTPSRPLGAVTVIVDDAANVLTERAGREAPRKSVARGAWRSKYAR